MKKKERNGKKEEKKKEEEETTLQELEEEGLQDGIMMNVEDANTQRMRTRTAAKEKNYY